VRYGRIFYGQVSVSNIVPFVSIWNALVVESPPIRVNAIQFPLPFVGPVRLELS